MQFDYIISHGYLRRLLLLAEKRTTVKFIQLRSNYKEVLSAAAINTIHQSTQTIKVMDIINDQALSWMAMTKHRVNPSYCF